MESFVRFSIGQFSKLTQVSIHTLRYYEKEKLMNPDRLKNGRRIFSQQDISWIQFIKRLKETNMPIKEIQKYAAFRVAGDQTLQQRMEMLIHHRESLQLEIERMQEHLSNLDKKIAYYEDRLRK